MRKSSPLAFCAVLGFATCGQGADEKAPEKQTADYIKVEMRGKLRILPRDKQEAVQAQVVVRAATGLGAKRCDLELPADKAIRESAQKLDGKTVLITGELITVYDLAQSAPRRYPPRDVVRVKTLKAAGPDK
jgi:hypothetical protein